MASSQVEIARSSPFGCTAVHNRRDSCYQNNLHNLVTSCIPNDNSARRIDFTDLWVHRPQWQTTTTNANSAANNKCNTSNSDDSNDYSGVKIDSLRQKDKWARAREVQSEGSVEVRNLGGVSSLVQKWRGFEAEAKCSSKSNSATIFQDNVGPDPAASVTNEDYPFGDWESDRTAVSGPPSSRSRDSDATESERLRVADIIRKLTEERLNEAGSDSPPRVRTSTDQSEQKCLSPVVNSPRIRGRQAYNDLLMQMERDRRKELEGLVGRKPVSQFCHRGRIQAMLRIRFLRRGMEAKEARQKNNSTLSESQKSVQSAILHFRINIPSAQNGSLHTGCCRKELTDNPSAAPNLYAANQRWKENQHQEAANASCPRERADQIKDLEGSITSKEHAVDHSCHTVKENIQHNIHQLHGYEHLRHEASVLSTSMMQGTNCKNSNDSLAKSVETATTVDRRDFNSAQTTKSLDVHETEEEATNHQIAETSFDLAADFAHPQSFEEGDASNQHLVGPAAYWVSDVSHPEAGWEELHTDYQQQEGSSRDWIDEVSRPRSDWEDLRQERYREMLDPFLDNEEIRVLLGRRSVSTFLSSGLREKIDRVMISRAQGEQTLMNNRTREEKHEQLPEQNQVAVLEVGERGDREDEPDEGREDYGDFFDEYEEAESSVGQQYNESDDYTDLITSSPAASWPQNQGPELSDDSCQVVSPCTRQSSSNYYSQDNGPNSSYSARPAIEMELIYDLRGHMEKLHQEMCELRKSIKCCMDMQIELQRSIKKEVAIALNHSDAKNRQRKSAAKKVTSGGRCCVCCKMQVDSLLYRCGHMCTCFKCGQELQWSSGNCPICSAPIVDVVRTYVYSSNIHA
ncbi:putative E3 ubiquitin ligase [Handroanthus impetiginosus]|uniref:Putative E3 ubiquitin ligase n=1 Tax=Handroanthus impetiginosus TaxID=429701 RepID=A0A2G9I3E2_9LAMI|nr:putative E3 ubiquitin ligase [Handroanthus impetiginosus]